MSEELDPSASAVLRLHFGRYWRAWSWVRRQFTLTSLSAIGSVLLLAGGYIVHLRQDVAVVRERVVVLETRVVPVLDESRLESNNALEIEDVKRRVGRIEGNLDLDYNEKVKAALAAGRPSPPARRRKAQ